MAEQPQRLPWWRRVGDALAARASAYRSRSMRWRLLAPAVFVVAGALFVTSMVSSGGTDLRAGRYDDLDGLANNEARDLAGLRAQASDLNGQVDRLSKDLGSSDARSARARADALRGPAGLQPVHGPGLTITLDDAPDEALAAVGDSGDVSQLLVHQQDIQAVANALWAGGAEAMTIQGQRVVATTGIKCVGNTVVLHGVPYSPPYRISAIGPADEMRSAVFSDQQIQLYLQVVEAAGLGWALEDAPELSMPGFRGSTDLEFARVG
ncbi:MAG: DUF881 domain-containing protein [Nocardioidaceae bacterium]|nr:DUF881 domain-containing protein [Nocardioidaceae bacterium]NUS49646.1 DUF881 domain-containing protein [Nocardioidaceae bacterium]